MQQESPHPGEDAAVGLTADAVEQAVLALVAELHPVQLTLDELVRETTDTPEDFGSRDTIEVAVRQLARTGLLHRHGPVRPADQSGAAGDGARRGVGR